MIRSTGTYVNGINLHVTERYLQETFDSCINVQFPSSGQLALDLMCGDWGAARCTPKRWYEFLGDGSKEHVPFQINYITHQSTDEVDGFRPLNPKIVRCNESVDVRSKWIAVKFPLLIKFVLPTGNYSWLLLPGLHRDVPQARTSWNEGTNFLAPWIWWLWDYHGINIHHRQFSIHNDHNMQRWTRGG